MRAQVHDAPAKPNYVAWLGGAIFGALDAMVSRSIPRDAYRQHRAIPDWNCPLAENPYKDLVPNSILGGGSGGGAFLDGRGSSSPLLRLKSTPPATSSKTSLRRESTTTTTTSSSVTGSLDGGQSPASVKRMDTS